MYCSQNSEEYCPKLGSRVTLTAAVEVEAGYGCSLAMDETEYTCARQEGCPFAGEAGCLLASLRSGTPNETKN